MKKATHIIGAALLSFAITAQAQAEEFKFSSPDIFVLGDSQILFGAGEPFLKFFENIDAHCAAHWDSESETHKLKDASVGILGVRSTALHSWVHPDDESKKRICTIDPNWHINASQFGTIKTTEKRFLQIGQEAPFKFCAADKSAFQTMFESGYYDPKLFVSYFLGNSSKRWAESKADAEQDSLAAANLIPAGMPCMLMTTAPSYRAGMNEVRLKAQQNFNTAYKKSGGTCSLVDGLTPETIKANVGNHLHFKHNEEEWVKDTFHPNARGIENFLALKTADICNAIAMQITKKVVARN